MLLSLNFATIFLAEGGRGCSFFPVQLLRHFRVVGLTDEGGFLSLGGLSDHPGVPSLVIWFFPLPHSGSPSVE